MIRHYTHTDKSAVLTLLKCNTPKYFDTSEEKDLDYYLEHHLEDYFVVLNDSKLIGAGGINYFYKEKTARLSWDIIHPDSQGKGIGSQLTQYRINLIHQNPKIDLIMVRTSQLTFRFYEKMGFELDHVQRDFWSKGYDLYQMTLKSPNFTSF